MMDLIGLDDRVVYACVQESDGPGTAQTSTHPSARPGPTAYAPTAYAPTVKSRARLTRSGPWSLQAAVERVVAVLVEVQR